MKEIVNDGGRYILSPSSEIIESCLDALNEKGNRRVLFGELEPNRNLIDVSLSQASHIIWDITADHDTIVANVKFLDTKIGKYVFDLINDGTCEFRPRVIGDRILTWDVCKK